MSGKKFIYNQKQANFFLSEGCVPVEWGYSKIKNKMYLVFNVDDIQDAFCKWIEKCKTYAESTNH